MAETVRTAKKVLKKPPGINSVSADRIMTINAENIGHQPFYLPL